MKWLDHIQGDSWELRVNVTGGKGASEVCDCSLWTFLPRWAEPEAEALIPHTGELGHNHLDVWPY